MKRSLWIAVIFIIAVSLICVSCGSTGGDSSQSGSNTVVEGSDNSESQGSGSSMPDQYEELSIIDQGYSMDEHNNMLYGVVIENPNSDVAFEYSELLITAYDENGEVLATREESASFIQPDDRMAFGSIIDCNGKKPSKVEFSVESGNAVTPSDKRIRSSELQATGINDRKDEYGGVTVTGKLMNMSDKKADSVMAVVLLRKDGKIVYGDFTYIDNIGAGNGKPFEFSLYDVPQYDAVEIIATDSSY